MEKDVKVKRVKRLVNMVHSPHNSLRTEIAF
jgi:hypothetical protein